jgi:hypothetical protein
MGKRKEGHEEVGWPRPVCFIVDRLLCVCTDLQVDESDGPLGLPREVLEEEVLLDGQQPRLPLGRQGAEVGVAQQHGRAHHHLRQREKAGGAEGEGGEEGREEVPVAGRKSFMPRKGICLYLR